MKTWIKPEVFDLNIKLTATECTVNGKVAGTNDLNDQVNCQITS
jgi:hypothetical protein